MEFDRKSLLDRGLKVLGLREKPASMFDASTAAIDDGLAELEKRIPPPGADVRPAYAPRYDRTQRLDPSAAAGGGLVTDENGNQVPHYWGHRERLRQRFLRGGSDALPEYEVLELLLFNAIPRIDVKPLAKRLLAEFGDLNAVVGASDSRLLKVGGTTDKVVYQLRLAAALAARIGRAKILDRCVLGSWDALTDYLRSAMSNRETEEFRVLYLDRRNALISDEAQGSGTVDHVPVYPREVAKRALELNASSVILVHNHPSGDPTPSDADVIATRRAVEACATVDVAVLDHVIVGRGSEVSLRDEGYI